MSHSELAAVRTPIRIFTAEDIPNADEFFKKYIDIDGKRQLDFTEFGPKSFHPLMRDFTFKNPLLLPEYLFPLGISFVHCTFKSEVSFKAAVFEGPAYFWNCNFEQKFSFFRTVVTDDGCRIEFREQGEVNFSYSRFEHVPGNQTFKQPSFDRATFSGPAFFHRTVFANGVSAEECRFKGGAYFESFESDICVHNDELAFLSHTFPQDTDSIRVQTAQERISSGRTRLLSTNTDHDAFHDFDSNIRSKPSLNRALIRALVGSEAEIPNTGWNRLKQSIKRIYRKTTYVPEDLPEPHVAGSDFEPFRSLWQQKFNEEMFGGLAAADKPEWISSFRGSLFGPGSRFSHVALSNCRFQGANVELVEFRVVDWVRQPCGLVIRRIPGFFSDLSRRRPEAPGWEDYIRLKIVPLISWRSAVRDEMELDSRVLRYGTSGNQFSSRRAELSDLYHELRIAYDRQGDSQQARDFYFGELESKRLSRRTPTRQLGLYHLYKIFSGYSKREGLALAWLLFYILTLFPLCFYVWANRAERHALSRSDMPLTEEALYFEQEDAPRNASDSPRVTFDSCVRAVGTEAERGNTLGSLVHRMYCARYFPTSQPPKWHLRIAAECRAVSPFVAANAPPAPPPSNPADDGRRRHNPAGNGDSDQRETGNGILDRGLDAVDGNGSPDSRYSRVLGTSMQASTFLPTSAQAGSIEGVTQMLYQVRCGDKVHERFYRNLAYEISGRENRRHLLEGLERLVVTAQAALFLLALRSRFQRTH